jgi:hypothetical protein
MIEQNEKDAVAMALYLEFRKENYTYQLVLTPDTVSMDKTKIHTSTLLSRRISAFHPRRNWQFTIARKSSRVTRTPEGQLAQTDLDTAKAFAEYRAPHVVSFLMNNLFTKGYTLYKQPIFVEASFKDIETIAQQKTPNDLWRRIVRSREAFDFGDAFFNAVAE